MTARKAAAPSVALAKRVDDRLEKLQGQIARLRTASKVQVIPAPAQLERALDARTLTDVAQLGELGYHPLDLTPEREAILSEPIDDAKVLILPSGAVYLPHVEYTRWFNRGFGRGAWTVVPAAKPTLTPIPNAKSRFLVTQVFVLFVHGKPIAQATGEGTYHENNAEQTHADVVEALNASALRRLAKRLGIGLELWDRAWGRTWQSKHAVRVKVRDKHGNESSQWRRKADPRLYGEQGGARDEEPSEQRDGQVEGATTRTRGAREPQATDDRTITKGTKEKPGQVERLWAIVKVAGRSKDELKGYLRIKLGIESTSDIKRRDYEQVITDIQRPGPMMLEAVETERREPGEEG